MCLSQAKDYERTTTANLKIQVENEEPLFVCPKKPKDPPDTAMIKVKVINLNDAPQFRTNPVNVFVREEEEPGKVLLVSDAFDVDSDPSELRLVTVVLIVNIARYDISFKSLLILTFKRHGS